MTDPIVRKSGTVRNRPTGQRQNCPSSPGGFSPRTSGQTADEPPEVSPIEAARSAAATEPDALALLASWRAQPTDQQET